MPSLPRIRPRRVAAPAAPPEDKRPRITADRFGFSVVVETAFWAILASFVVATLGFFRHKRWL